MSSDNVYVFQLYFCRDNNTIPSILVIFRSSIEVEEVPQIPDLILTIKAMLYLEGGFLCYIWKGEFNAMQYAPIDKTSPLLCLESPPLR